MRTRHARIRHIAPHSARRSRARTMNWSSFSLLSAARLSSNLTFSACDLVSILGFSLARRKLSTAVKTFSRAVSDRILRALSTSLAVMICMT
jgi:hypothetical protein